MIEIKHMNSRDGGLFYPRVKAGDFVVIVIGSHKADGVLVEGASVFGLDYEISRAYGWTFQDYNVVLNDDFFDRQSSLLRILKKGGVSIFLNPEQGKPI